MTRAPIPKLSILIPTISERTEKANRLYENLEARAAGLPVEILMLRENLLCGIGEARNMLLRASRGEYITFLDDDDCFLPGYFERVLPALDQGSDVVSYDQEAIIDGVPGLVTTLLGNPVSPFVPRGTTLRPPWFWCAWKRDLATAYAVPQVRRNEDVLWLRHLWAEAETETHIDAPLHLYDFRSDQTTLQK